MKFPRSTREAFACERYPAIFGPYRRGDRVADVLLACVLGIGGAALLFFWWSA